MYKLSLLLYCSIVDYDRFAIPTLSILGRTQNIHTYSVYDLLRVEKHIMTHLLLISSCSCHCLGPIRYDLPPQMKWSYYRAYSNVAFLLRLLYPSFDLLIVFTRLVYSYRFGTLPGKSAFGQSLKVTTEVPTALSSHMTLLNMILLLLCLDGMMM